MMGVLFNSLLTGSLQIKGCDTVQFKNVLCCEDVASLLSLVVNKDPCLHFVDPLVLLNHAQIPYVRADEDRIRRCYLLSTKDDIQCLDSLYQWMNHTQMRYVEQRATEYMITLITGVRFVSNTIFPFSLDALYSMCGKDTIMTASYYVATCYNGPYSMSTKRYMFLFVCKAVSSDGCAEAASTDALEWTTICSRLESVKKRKTKAAKTLDYAKLFDSYVAYMTTAKYQVVMGKDCTVEELFEKFSEDGLDAYNKKVSSFVCHSFARMMMTAAFDPADRFNKVSIV